MVAPGAVAKSSLGARVLAAREAASGRVVRGPERERHEPDHLLLVAIVALAALGSLMIYSSGAGQIAWQPDGNLLGTVLPDLSWTLLGLCVMLILLRIDYRWLRMVSVPGYLAAVLLLVAVLLPGVGYEFGGSTRSLHLGSLPSIHPAEFAKLALVVYLAHWMARRGEAIGSFLHGMLPFLVLIAPVILLVAVEPDLGTTGVLTLSAFTMFFVAGASVVQLLAMVPLGIVAVAIYVMHNAYQMNRITSFWDPLVLASTSGYHAAQGLLALSLGGLMGSGLGQSRGPGGLNLPEASNDFIFALIGQELGLVGGVLVIGLFLFFAWRGVRIALAAPDTFGALLAVGITAWLTIQAFINIGVVLALLPVTGITLPFVSSGGSSMVVSFAAVGILLSISRETISRGNTIDADPGSSGGNRRPHLPRLGRAPVAGPTAP